ncbi:putative isopropanol dehydrogenase [Stipitochalara longipes BDJ]|nr:putative isopropanol dehydrogenase [Stipitochalara longipes BDJ]
MSTQRALVLRSRETPLSLENVPIPTAVPGSVVVKVFSTYILPNLSSVLNGTAPHSLALPLTPGANTIGRIHAVGPDSTVLKAGQLVFCDMTVNARDDPDTAILLGLHGGAAMKLMEGEWRNGSFAEYAKFPLENVFILDEEILCGKLGYSIDDFCALPAFLTPFGGLSEINLLPGETIIIAPATGRYGGGAVTMALAMGATVVACGRNETTLSALKKTFGHTGRLETIVLTGDVKIDTAAMITASRNGDKGADAFIDFSPAAAAKSTHIAAAMAALKTFGRACFMGGIYGNVEINYFSVMMKSLRIQGRFMYSRDMAVRFIKMVEKGNLKLGEEATGMRIIGKFGLDRVYEAIELAEREKGWGKQVLLMP